MLTAEYESWVRKGAIHPESVNYVAAGLAAEAGEANNDLVRLMRKHGVTEITPGMLTDPERSKLLTEAGDVLWNLVRLLQLLDSDLETCMAVNRDKIERRERDGIAYRSELVADP